MEAFCVYGWQTCFLDVIICPKSKYGVCQAGFSTINPVMANSKMAATKTTNCHIFGTNHDKNTNKACINTLLDTRNPLIPLLS